MNRPTASRFSALLLGLLVVPCAGCAAEPPPPPSPPTVTAAARKAPPPPEVKPVAAPEPAAPPVDDRFAKVTIEVQKVSGNVYMLKGAGGNIAVLVGDDGIVIVDDQFAPLAPKIRAALKGISDKPVKFVVNTHWHGDHTGGNVAFSNEASIVAHENVRKRLLEGRPAIEIAGKTRDPIPPAPKEALPIVTFEDSVSIHVNGEDIRAIHVPHGHTDGDSLVYFPHANVVHMGDDFTMEGFPFIDVASGGSVRGLVGAIDKAVALLPADVKVIPGHGTLSTLDDVKKFSAAVKDVVKIVDAEVKKKKTLEQLKAQKVIAKYDDLGKGFITTDSFLETVYKELTAPPAAPTKPAGAAPPAKPATTPTPAH